MKIRTALACCLLSAGAMRPALAQEPPVGVADQQALLKSHDPKLAANKKLVYDMYRAIVIGGHYEMAEKFFTREYIQHNPNVTSGRDALVEFIRNSRPQREIPPEITFPLISIVAEGDMVVVATVTWEPDPEKPGERYATTHFDMYRIENGLIAEHWDHVPRSSSAKTFDPNTILENAPVK
ncbi:MAG: nuclear transport factor 2 family protein [Pseudomonadota bacterium]|jgi:predicted SnoaL-like aldol condensation-catalyzing enzyme